ncbi:hypothetical protein HDV05_006964 [Chytridiales sp. JEL 0842]|nr:hypothetical protein HDV05_006964 [Chytridiales sp. JEL 0842]
MMGQNEDTEWNDILREKGILPPKELEVTEDEIIAMVDKAVQQRYGEKPIEEMNLDELDEIEDEEDDRVLEQYRRQRMAEMQAQASKEIFGSVTQISKTDWQREVTDASKDVWVVVHLFQNQLPACKLINAHLDTLARKYRATKFLKIVGDQCIPNYPDRNCPTLIIYGNGDIKANLVGISLLGGVNARVGDLETILGRVGAIEVKPKDEDEVEEEVAAKMMRITRMAKGTDDSDDDWD